MSNLSPTKKISTTPARSRLMARVRRSGTAPELALRTALRRVGLRCRLDAGSGLPGSPDITFRRSRLAIFVDGCFWHGCPRHGTVPKTNTSFWMAKILRNRQRDRLVDRTLKRLGWKVLRVWEHQVRRDLVGVVQRIEELLRAESSEGSASGHDNRSVARQLPIGGNRA
jgi:DNA mismatch endonuclease (patch repair protein)